MYQNISYNQLHMVHKYYLCFHNHHNIQLNISFKSKLMEHCMINNFNQKIHCKFYIKYYKENRDFLFYYYNIHRDKFHNTNHQFLIYKIGSHMLNMLKFSPYMQHNLSNILNINHLLCRILINSLCCTLHLSHYRY